MSRIGARVLIVCAACMALVGFGGSVLLLTLPAVAQDFHAAIGGLARLGAILAVGSAVALPLSAVADRWRRGPIATLGVLGFSLAALGSAAAPGIAGLASARFVAVCFETLVVAVVTAAAVEAVDPTRRGRTTALLSLSAGAGAGATVLAYPLVAPHWRWLYLVAGVCGVLVAPLALRLPSMPPDRRGGAASLLGPPWRGRLVILAAASALGGLLYEPANFFSVLFGSTRLHLSPTALSGVLAASGLAAGAGFIAGGVLSDRYGRRLPAMLLGTCSAVLASASFIPVPAVYVSAGIGWSAAAGAAAPVVAAWTAELFPTRGRVTSYTAVGVAGALGGVVGLGVAGWLNSAIGLSGAAAVLALPAVAGTLLLAVLPDTRGEVLAG